MTSYIVLFKRKNERAWKTYSASTRQKAAANGLADGWRHQGWTVIRVFTKNEWNQGKI